MILLFINHRSVESTAIKKAVEQTYSTFLPKGGHPFLYLSLEIDPKRVDVNVHPTKREVNFLNEDEIIESICSEISLRLSTVDTSRTFTTQSLLPGANTPTVMTPKTQTNARKSTQQPPSSASSRPSENNMIRTDPYSRKITSMLSHLNSESSFLPKIAYLESPREATYCRLTTVKELRAAVRDSMHNSLTEIFASHTYVGLVDAYRRITAIQGGVRLFLVDYGMICNEFFYQVGLTDFGNFGVIRFERSFDIKALIRIGVESEKNGENIAWEEVADVVTAQLVGRREMLLEYFQMEVTESGQLVSLPILIKDYSPSMLKLPRFLMRLGPCVNWTEEKACFHTFLKELADFYTPQRILERTEEAKGEPLEVGHLGNGAVSGTNSPDNMEHLLEHILFPALKSKLIATRGLLKGVVEIGNLKGLYKVFERC